MAIVLALVWMKSVFSNMLLNILKILDTWTHWAHITRSSWLALTAKVWTTVVYISNFVKPELAMYLHCWTLQWQLLEFVRLPPHPVYIIEKALSCLAFPSPLAAISMVLFWGKFVQKYEEFWLDVFRYTLTLPSWTLNKLNTRPTYHFVSSFQKYSLLLLINYMAFFFL